MTTPEEVKNLKQIFSAHGAKTTQKLLSALLIWLFGVLVFIPTAASIGSNVELMCNIIILVSFTILVSRTFGPIKNLIDASAFLPAQKYITKRGWDYENAITVSKQMLYLTLAVILYLLYFPFLVRIHTALNGIALIIVIGIIFFLAVKAFRASRDVMRKWLYS